MLLVLVVHEGRRHVGTQELVDPRLLAVRTHAGGIAAVLLKQISLHTGSASMKVTVLALDAHVLRGFVVFITADCASHFMGLVGQVPSCLYAAC